MHESSHKHASSAHKLAAIMFTDIVGYTAIMGSDEDRAFEILRKNQEIHKAIIANFNGTLIKEIGDGMLISFPLATDAVKCAIEIQKACKDQEIPLKIGIHEGEMVFAGDDVYGDGVNIASRLQEVADDGCIAISERVYADIKNKSEINTKLIGVKKLKNVEDPMKVYEVLSEKRPIIKEGGVIFLENLIPQKRHIIFSGIFIVVLAAFLSWYYFPSETVVGTDKSIAVLPFGNASSDEENQYFVDGMMEDIRNNLSEIADLRVISKTSTEKYRQTDLLSSEIGSELNVVYLLEGTIQKQGDQLKIHAQLIKAKNNAHVWSETYERNLADVFKIQSEIAHAIADKFKIAITPQTTEKIDKVPTTNIQAYELYLKARSIPRKLGFGIGINYRGEIEAISLLKEAIALDPDYIQPYLFLAELYLDASLDPDLANLENIGSSDSAVLLLKEAISRDPTSADGYIAMAFTQNYESSLEWLLKACELDSLKGLLGLGYSYLDNSKFPKAIQCFSEAVKFDPNSREPYLGKAIVYSNMAQLDSMNKYLALSDKMDPNTRDTDWIRMYTGPIANETEIAKKYYGEDTLNFYKHMGGTYMGARDWEMAKSYYIKSGYRDMDWGLILIKTGNREEGIVVLKNSLAHRGSKGWWGDISRINAVLGNKAQAISEFRELIGRGFHQIGFVRNDPFWDEVRDEPEFKVIEEELERRNVKMLDQIKENQNKKLNLVLYL